jgi:hypothetical protein
MSKAPLEKLLLNGLELTARSIEDDLPSIPPPGAGMQVLNVLAPSQQNTDGYAKLRRGIVEKEIALKMEPGRLFEKHNLLKDGITLVDLACCPHWWVVEEGARHAERRAFCSSCLIKLAWHQAKKVQQNMACPFKPFKKQCRNYHTPVEKQF